MLNTPRKSLLTALQEIHKPGTLNGILYETHPQTYQNVIDVRTRSITLDPRRKFEYYGIAGSNIETALHAVYERPVADYSELLLQEPMFSHVNGDGTVPVLSALSDPFPKQYVGDRIVLPGAEHFGIL